MNYTENPKLEAKYSRLSALGKELKVPTFGAFLQMEVIKDGKVLHAHKQRSHSWNRNAYNWFLCQAALVTQYGSSFADGYLTVKNTSGTVKNSGTYALGWTRLPSAPPYEAAVGNDNQGILAGSGSDAESFDGYALGSKIANGTGAGQLSYQGCSISRNWDSPSTTFEAVWTRFLNNNSGGSIDVNEVGLVAYLYCFDNQDYIMVCRDLLDSTIAVPDTGQMKVTYTIELVYPE